MHNAKYENNEHNFQLRQLARFWNLYQDEQAADSGNLTRFKILVDSLETNSCTVTPDERLNYNTYRWIKVYSDIGTTVYYHITLVNNILNEHFLCCVIMVTIPYDG